MNNFQNPYYFMMNYGGYPSNNVGNPYYQNQTSYPNPSELLAYGPYQQGPSAQMIPPEWFGYYVQTSPYLTSTVPDIAYYINPQFLPNFR